MTIEYVATEFSGDPPQPAAKWYKVRPGTYARATGVAVEFLSATALKVELSVGSAVTFVAADDSADDIEAVRQAWAHKENES